MIMYGIANPKPFIISNASGTLRGQKYIQLLFSINCEKNPMTQMFQTKPNEAIIVFFLIK